jgi:hypothetical protein
MQTDSNSNSFEAKFSACSKFYIRLIIFNIPLCLIA